MNNFSNDSNKSYFEGKSKEVLLTQYERNPAARKKSLEYHGFSCKICGFNFEQHFGEVGRGFIHVHHINPISTIAQKYQINPIEDLIPVCPNCHAMIHSKIPAYSITEIKNIRQINEKE
ncbi:restriction endonuclease [Leptospira idonii]|uniref:Restriction endonuclease n=2 Tax=Leptospira idonii TaxID=1193500 RepID=A0A4R9M0I2_9LEPT|nr:restriction endonuclease [Leptospira idonii]